MAKDSEIKIEKSVDSLLASLNIMYDSREKEAISSFFFSYEFSSSFWWLFFFPEYFYKGDEYAMIALARW